MSSAEVGKARVTLSRRELARGLAVLIATVPALSACGSDGFRPLYAQSPSGAGMSERMAQVDISPIPGRVGQRIRNELIYQSTGGGTQSPPIYRLEVTLQESVLSTLVRPDGNALGQIYSMIATFKLVSLKDSNKVVMQGSSHGRASFERFDSIYSNVRAREDAENRAARTVADDLKTRVAIYLSKSA
jgi:LPS-assembly lipoprotein